MQYEVVYDEALGRRIQKVYSTPNVPLKETEVKE